MKVTFPCIGLKLSLMQRFSTQMLGGHSKDVRIHAGTTKGNCLAIRRGFMGLYFFVFSFTNTQKPFDKRYFWLQVVTVGVVGGSDLSKISEQLGKTGLLYLSLSHLLVRESEMS